MKTLQRKLLDFARHLERYEDQDFSEISHTMDRSEIWNSFNTPGLANEEREGFFSIRWCMGVEFIVEKENEAPQSPHYTCLGECVGASNG